MAFIVGLVAARGAHDRAVQPRCSPPPTPLQLQRAARRAAAHVRLGGEDARRHDRPRRRAVTRPRAVPTRTRDHARPAASDPARRAAPRSSRRPCSAASTSSSRGRPDRPIRSPRARRSTRPHVTVEINDTFAHLMGLLEATKPAKVNAALTALATALQGRGHEAGQLLTKLDTYLQQINPTLGTLQHDLPLARSVLGTYSALDAGPAAYRAQPVTTSDTIQDNQASLDAFLLSLTTVSSKTTTFVQRNQHNLTTTLDVLPPTERVLAEYAPSSRASSARWSTRPSRSPRTPSAASSPASACSRSSCRPSGRTGTRRTCPRSAPTAGRTVTACPTSRWATSTRTRCSTPAATRTRTRAAKPGLTPGNLLELFFGPITERSDDAVRREHVSRKRGPIVKLGVFLGRQRGDLDLSRHRARQHVVHRRPMTTTRSSPTCPG